jgi:hypothetical protein
VSNVDRDSLNSVLTSCYLLVLGMVVVSLVSMLTTCQSLIAGAGAVLKSLVMGAAAVLKSSVVGAVAVLKSPCTFMSSLFHFLIVI